MESKKGAHPSKKKVLIIVLVALIVALIIIVVSMVALAGQEKRDADLNRQIKEIAQNTTEPVIDQVYQDFSSDDTVIQNPEIPVNFQELKEVSPDIYAWVKVAGTAIDYPIVQDDADDSFYLTHNVAGQESIEGSIYTELVNNKDFSDPNTVIYGHNMKNGSMFAALHQYEDKAFFDKNKEIVIYTPTEKLVYEVFAAYKAGDEHLMHTYDFENPTVFNEYIAKIMQIRDMKSNVDKDITISEKDKIITLSTCIKGQDTNRYIVQAVLKENE